MSTNEKKKKILFGFVLVNTISEFPSSASEPSSASTTGSSRSSGWPSTYDSVSTYNESASTIESSLSCCIALKSRFLFINTFPVSFIIIVASHC